MGLAGGWMTQHVPLARSGLVIDVDVDRARLRDPAARQEEEWTPAGQEPQIVVVRRRRAPVPLGGDVTTVFGTGHPLAVHGVTGVIRRRGRARRERWDVQWVAPEFWYCEIPYVARDIALG